MLLEKAPNAEIKKLRARLQDIAIKVVGIGN